MKKSKVIIPALGVLILSTAASVTGTVAWFTANRTATITAGEFAVVNTNSNLAVTLNNGVGVTCSENTTVTQKANHTLTDSSFDHTDTTLPVIVPDSSRTTIASKVTSYSEANFLRSGTVGDSAVGVYSAFAWDITFTITFPGAAIYDMGIFLDLSASYAHEKYVVANGHQYTAADAGTYYTDAACTTGEVSKTAGNTQSGDATYYKPAPDATGKGLRLAFVPKTVAGANDIAYAKIIAPNQASDDVKFIDNPTIDAAIPAGTSYSSGATVKMTNNTASTETIANKVLIANDLNNTDTVPADHAKTHASALAQNANYLAFMKLNAGNSTSITFTCLVWYEGTDPTIVAAADNFETMVLGLKFAAVELA